MPPWTYGGHLWRWCCPVCGNLNDLSTEVSRAGFCQHEPCISVRGELSRTHLFRCYAGVDAGPLRLQPEIIRAFERPLPWGMA